MNRADADQVASKLVDDAVCLRIASNAVYRSGEMILRICQPTVDYSHLSSQLDFAAWLSGQGFPTAAPLSQEIEEVDGYLVTRWQLLDLLNLRVNPFEAGKLLRRFHDLSDSYPGSLPEADPYLRLDYSGTSYSSLSGTDREILSERYHQLSDQAPPLRLDSGVIHGDFTAGNILSLEDGLALIDFDYLARGCRDLDLIPFLAYSRFYDGPAATSFLIGYGLSVQDCQYLDNWVLLRALAATYWAGSVDSDAGRKEAQRRMRYWRQGEPLPFRDL